MKNRYFVANNPRPKSWFILVDGGSLAKVIIDFHGIFIAPVSREKWGYFTHKKIITQETAGINFSSKRSAIGTLTSFAKLKRVKTHKSPDQKFECIEFIEL